MRLHLSVHGGPEPSDIAADTQPEHTIADLTAALSSQEPGAPLWVDGVPVDPTTELGESPVRDGSIVSPYGPSPTGAPRADSGLYLYVVGGPDAGAVTPLRDGAVVLGQGARLQVWGDELTLQAAAGSASVEDTVVTGQTSVTPDEMISLGDARLAVRRVAEPDAVLTPTPDGKLAYNRPPRLLATRPPVRIAGPGDPPEHERRPLSVVGMVLPLLMAAVAAYAMHEPRYLLLALASPAMMLAQWISDRRRGRVAYHRRLDEHWAATRRARREYGFALRGERADRRAAAPDPGEVLLIAQGPRHRLWERRRTDPDFLLLRVGLGDLPAETELVDGNVGTPAPAERLNDVPATVALSEVGVLGVAGSPAQVRGTARWLAAQAAVLHSPRDLRVVMLAEDDSWSALRWLPHARPQDGQPCLTLIGNSPDSINHRVAELLALIEARKAVSADSRAAVDVDRLPTVLVVLDGAHGLRAVPGIRQILQDGPRVGVFALCLDADQRLLPEECTAVISYDLADPARVSLSRAGAPRLDGVLADAVGVTWAEQVARALAPIRDVNRDDGEVALPDAVRLLDLYGLEPPSAPAIATGWAACGRTTEALVGVGADGPLRLDLRRDGPHALIAGTTGAGKSELLQTLIASLAIGNRPDELTFVLVDYKGGSAFADCARLPHTVGMVSDLDGHLTQRALASLSAELKRRETILAQAGTKDLDDYCRARDRGDLTEHFPPMPRLVLVIDEFASLVAELPDFVKGLVGIAQRGRSLGVHLILATQRPGGVVSPEIRANTNLRMALRVTDVSESTDVIDASDAAHIARSRPGRGYVRTGHASLTGFQAARVGGPRPAASASQSAPWVVVVPWERAGEPLPARPVGAPDENTDLRVLVDAIDKAAAEVGVTRLNSPWMPPLPADIELDGVPTVDAATDLVPIPYGLKDLPAAQQQKAAYLDLPTFGHLLAAGAPRSGRSQLLRTIAGSVALRHSCAEVHVYGIDCGNGALLPIAELPHCGAVVTRNQDERATRLLTRLDHTLRQRQDLLAQHGYADITEQRAADSTARLPHILVLLDRWDGFTATLGELNGGELTEIVYRLLRDGASVGMHLVITGDRTVLSSRIATMTENKIAFRMPDKGDLMMLGLRARDLPDEMPPGRVFRNETGIETQVALLPGDPTGTGQGAALTRIAGSARERDSAVPAAARPFRVDQVPTSIGFDEAWAVRDQRASGPMWAMVGVGGDELTSYGPDLATGLPAFIVAGPRQSGRSTLLLTMARSLLATGTQLIIAAPRPSPLRDLAGTPGVLTTFVDGELLEDELSDALAAASGACAIIVDDGEVLRDCEAGPVLEQLLSTGTHAQRALVLGGTTDELCTGFSGWQVSVKRCRRGALLAPQSPGDADLIGTRLPRGGLATTPMGRAYLHLGGGTALTVQVPRTNSRKEGVPHD